MLDPKDTKEALVPSHPKNVGENTPQCAQALGLIENFTNTPHSWVRRNFIGSPGETGKGLTGYLVS